MRDYTLSIGEHAPYGFSSASDAEALRHAVAYVAGRHAAESAARPDLGVSLAGPSGPLTGPTEDLRAFCARVGPQPGSPDVDDVRTGDPVTPDCNDG